MFGRIRNFLDFQSKSLAAPDGELLALMGIPAGSQALGLTRALTVPSVQSAVSLISGSIASFDILVERREGDQWVRDDAHPIAMLLADRPNDWSSTFELIRDLVATALTHDKGALAFVEVSRQLLKDNQYDLEGELASDLGESFAIAEGSAFVSGNGTGKPKGILNAAGVAIVVSGDATTIGTNGGDTLIDVFAAVPTLHAQNGAWMMNRKTLATVRKAKDGMGNYLWQPGLQAGSPSTLLGRPVIEAVDMPDIAANAFPVVFGDWSGYRIVDRVDMSILSDPYTRATNGINVFHARKRVGGDVTHPDRFAKLKIAAS